ncbi:MAG: ADP-ribosylglycohydrolase family protein [Myxococcota bacterium]
MNRQQAIRGVLLGTAVGDSIGLPYENLSPGRIARLAPTPLAHRLLPGRGMLSDDTEHTYMVGCALTRSMEPAAFQRTLAWQLRLWLWALPGGIGFATLRALIKLSIGISPRRSGVFSAGNGPAMRAALIGVVAPEEQIRPLTEASSTITHTDPRAVEGAVVVAILARWLMEDSERPAAETLRALADVCREEALASWLRQAAGVAERRGEVSVLVTEMGLQRGVTGFVLHTVPVAVFIALTAPSFSAAIESAVRLGGDTDSVGAIVGALSGVRFGPGAIPEGWVAGIADWPLNVGRLEDLAETLDGGGRAPFLPFPLTLLRNVGVFIPVILLHVFRRLLPPY